MLSLTTVLFRAAGSVIGAFPLLILRRVKKGTLLLDSSTIDPSVAREMALAAEKMGAVFMDAPVSGGKQRTDHNVVFRPRSHKLALFTVL